MLDKSERRAEADEILRSSGWEQIGPGTWRKPAPKPHVEPMDEERRDVPTWLVGILLFIYCFCVVFAARLMGLV